MAQKFFVPVTIQDLSSSGSDALNVFIDTESYARLKLEAGGRLVWGDGTGAGDTNLYRDSANVLKTDDKFIAGKELASAWSSGDEGGEIQLAIPQTNTSISTGVVIDVYQNKLRMYENGGSFRGAYIDLTAASNGVASNLLTGSGGGATTLDDLTDVATPTPSTGDFLKYNGSAWVNDPINLSTDTVGDYVASLVAGTNVALTNNSGEGATPTVTVSGALTSIDSISSPDYVQFDTSVGSPSSTEGKLQWDSDFGTLSFGLEGNNSVQQLGMNQFAYCYNADSVTLAKGTPVYIFGGQGSQVSIKRALNTGDATSATTLGLVSESIASGASGYVCTYGVLQGIDTTAYNEGDILYLGATAGTLTTTKPSAPNHYVFVGVVIKDDVGGEIWLRPQNGFELDEIHNVSAGSPSSGDFLKYNGTLWVNDPINLGTDTVGDYVSSLVAGTGISLANNSGEGATPTISSVGARVSDSPPSSPVTGQIWYESDTGKLFVYADSFWVEVGAGASNESGKVIQTVTSSTTTAAGDSAGTWTDSNLSCSITPKSASNNIIVMITQSMYNFYNNTGSYVGMNIRLLRGSSTTLQTFADAGFIRIGAGTGADTVFQFATNYVDSPNTTSSVTYKTQIARALGGSTVYAQVNSNPGTMILMEVVP